jgi:hypothetical protein
MLPGAATTIIKSLVVLVYCQARATPNDHFLRPNAATTVDYRVGQRVLGRELEGAGGRRRGAKGQGSSTTVMVSINEKGAAVLLWFLGHQHQLFGPVNGGRPAASPNITIFAPLWDNFHSGLSRERMVLYDSKK